MLKLGVFVHYKSKPFFSNLLGICEKKNQILLLGFDDNFSGYPLITDSVCHVGKVLKALRFHYMPKVDD